jgi:hypothetical protein
VRFAALGAVLALDPPTPYPGSSRVPLLLDHFARGGGGQSSVVAMPVIEKAATVGGLLGTAGYDAEVASTGNELVRLALDAADAEFVVVDATIDRPGVRDVVFSLRTHPRTAGLPVAVLASADREYRAYQLAGEVTGVVAFPRPHTPEAAVALVEKLIAAAGRNYVTVEERAHQAAFALDQWSRLLASRDTFYDVSQYADRLSGALYRDDISEPAIASLALVGAPASQRSLVDYANRFVGPIEGRKAAADAFDRNVRRHGVLLTTDEILHQYNVYNASETSDAQTQQLLGQLLDTIEAGKASP